MTCFNALFLRSRQPCLLHIHFVIHIMVLKIALLLTLAFLKFYYNKSYAYNYKMCSNHLLQTVVKYFKALYVYLNVLMNSIT